MNIDVPAVLLLPHSTHNSGVGHFILSSNEARPHLLDDITLQRQEEAVLVGIGDQEFSRGSQTQSFYSNTVSKQPPIFT